MNYQQKDRDHIWHPYTHLKGFKGYPAIEKGSGALLYDTDGNRYIDAVSSWWVNLHGHAHPYIADKIHEQAQNIEHVIFGNFTHPPAVELSTRLLEYLPDNQSKIFFSDNGSTAVEIGLKMAIQYFYNQGSDRQDIIAFSQGYHGDTFGSMSVGSRSAFSAPFSDYLFDVLRIDVPTPGQEEKVLSQLEDHLKNRSVAAFIFEPIVLGVAGMVMYSPEVLDQMLALCRKHNVITIADEVMTGFGRTGPFFATDACERSPDIICMSKGATAGTLAIGLTSCTQAIQDAFRSDDPKKTFFHGHSFTANPLACVAGTANLDLLERPETQQQRQRIAEQHKSFEKRLSGHPKIRDIRKKGTIIAVEVDAGAERSYFNKAGDIIREFAQEEGVLLRPLGNVVYIIPPYCIKEDELDEVYQVIEAGLEKV
jgi:adenosylmethionine-8-amino-7-oxononanoate aminotransferase